MKVLEKFVNQFWNTGQPSEVCSIWVSFRPSFSPPRFTHSLNLVPYDALYPAKQLAEISARSYGQFLRKKRISPKIDNNCEKSHFEAMLPAPLGYYGRKFGTRWKELPRTSGVLSLIQFLRAAFEKNAKNQKSAKKFQIYPFWGFVPDPRGYLGH